MLYLANPTRGSVPLMVAGRLGYIDTPAQGGARPAGVAWCADNGCFGTKYPGDAGWFAWLARQGDAGTCLFATAPDVPCDHQRTYLRADPWLDRIRSLGYPAAFVAQNGARPHKMPWTRFDVLFLGGDDAFKLGPHARELVVEARTRGLRVHMGRVNSRRRLRYAEAIGCDTADGTYLCFAPRKNLPRLSGWVDELDAQEALFPPPGVLR